MASVTGMLAQWPGSHVDFVEAFAEGACPRSEPWMLPLFRLFLNLEALAWFLFAESSYRGRATSGSASLPSPPCRMGTGSCLAALRIPHAKPRHKGPVQQVKDDAVIALSPVCGLQSCLPPLGRLSRI